MGAAWSTSPDFATLLPANPAVIKRTQPQEVSLTSGTPADLASALGRIADALERISPPPPAPYDFGLAVMHRYAAASGRFAPAPGFALPLELLRGVERQRDALVTALRRFAVGAPANNALLWGARGTGKSSLVKAAVTALARETPALKLVEIEREALPNLPDLFATLRDRPQRFVVLCDDLSFEQGAGAAKSLKSALEGGVMGPPPNVLFVATSNRRHLTPRGHEDGDRLSAAEDAEETISASDRFGLWLGFPPMDQATYLAAVAAYAERFGLDDADLAARALKWAQLRGGRSGRTALQFIRDLAGEQGRPLPL
jgi:predicted AAA+ superfamily ATPase